MAKKKVKPLGFLSVSAKHHTLRFPQELVAQLEPLPRHRSSKGTSIKVGWEPNARIVILFNPQMDPIDLLKSFEIMRAHLMHKHNITEADLEKASLPSLSASGPPRINNSQRGQRK